MTNLRWVQVATTKTKHQSLRDERVNLFKMIRPLSSEERVPGQFRALTAILGDAPCETETQIESAESALTM